MIGGVLLIVVLGVVLFGIIFMVSRQNVGKAVDRQFVNKSWHQVQSLLNSEFGAMSAVTQADMLLDYALRKLGYPGETMGERLRSASGRFKNTDAVWSAHKLRNQIAHEAGFIAGKPRVKQAVNDLRRALQDLGAL